MELQCREIRQNLHTSSYMLYQHLHSMIAHFRIHFQSNKITANLSQQIYILIHNMMKSNYMHIYYLSNNNWTTLRCKKLFFFHHINNQCGKILHLILQKIKMFKCFIIVVKFIISFCRMLKCCDLYNKIRFA